MSAPPADVAILELREGNVRVPRQFQQQDPGKQRLFPSGTVLAGKAGAGVASALAGRRVPEMPGAVDGSVVGARGAAGSSRVR